MLIRIRTFLCYFLLSSVYCFSTIQTVKASDLADGKKTFENVCAACHKLGGDLVGPDLTGVKSRWKDEKKLIAFVHNSQAVIKSGDPYATALFKKYHEMIMPPQDLSDEQIVNVLDYVNDGGASASAGGGDATSSGGGAVSGGGGGGATVTPLNNSDSFLGMPHALTLAILIIILIILLGVALVLFRVRRRVAMMNWEKDHPGEIYISRSKDKGWLGSQWHYLRTTVNPVIAVVLILIVMSFISVVALYVRAQDVGTQIGYAPEQPIRFNHKLHAGQYGINCQYCHTGVMDSKNATVPPLGTCMNCHDYVKEGPQYGKTEIAKVIDHYEKKKPVKWIRIHNLPAHVYFNHAQHVNAGKLDCANCHGAVAEMARVQQVATLEMGWCVNCHREHEIDADNPYYNTYDFVKKHKKYSVAQMGGIECAKCHY